ncbi:glycosyltransferase [Muricoccus radiodurans]|uniref:glycosyltransferase n=1 Tax=Muricoccus radiodurans TaxID=2231721 RepID=UPI003CE819BA
MSPPRVSVAVFAYNEERTITACLDALGALTGEAALTVHVLANGCTDGTEAVLRAYRPQGFTLQPAIIARGDKANAWNTYVHELAPHDAALHVFTDGDMTAAPGSIAGFLERFSAEPEANGCAALPISGRSRDKFREKLVQRREMAGNLYALRGSTVAAFRETGVRLPFGMFGEDGLVTALVKHDLDLRRPRNDRRVTATTAGGFAYPPLSPWSLRDWRIYRNRRMRYAVRRQQAEMLYPLLAERGIEAMPAHVVDLYRDRHGAMRRGWNGLDTWFDWVARRRILRDAAAAETARDEDRAHLYS